MGNSGSCTTRGTTVRLAASSGTTNAPGQATGFYPYNPFGIGAEWRTAPVEPGIDYVGNFLYRGSVPRQADSGAQCHGRWRCFRPRTWIRWSSSWTSSRRRRIGYAVFVPQPLVPHLGDAMVAFWGAGQVEELGGAIDRVLTGTGTNYRWEFDQEEPNEIIYGPDPGVRTVTAADAGDADLLAGEALADHEVLEFPPGKYLVDAFQGTRGSADADLRGTAYRVMSGNDDHLVQYGSGRSNASNDPLGRRGGAGHLGQVIAFPVFTFTVADGETGQLTFITAGFNTGTVEVDSTFRVFVTKIG